MCTVLAQLLVRNSSVLVYLTTLNFILDFNFFYQRNRYLAVINNGMSVYERLQFFWIISLKVVRNCHKDGSFLTPKKDNDLNALKLKKRSRSKTDKFQ